MAASGLGPRYRNRTIGVAPAAMTDDLANLLNVTETALAAVSDLRAWDSVRVATLGRNGSLTTLLRDLGQLPPHQRRQRGAALNRLKDTLYSLFEARRVAL